MRIAVVGAGDLTMPAPAALIGRAIDRPVAYFFIDSMGKDVDGLPLARLGIARRRRDDALAAAALNEGRLRFHGVRRPLPTSMATFGHEACVPPHRASIAMVNASETSR